MRTSERVLNLTSKQHFREIHTQICYADLFFGCHAVFLFFHHSRGKDRIRVIQEGLE